MVRRVAALLGYDPTVETTASLITLSSSTNIKSVHGHTGRRYAAPCLTQRGKPAVTGVARMKRQSSPATLCLPPCGQQGNGRIQPICAAHGRVASADRAAGRARPLTALRRQKVAVCSQTMPPASHCPAAAYVRAQPELLIAVREPWKTLQHLCPANLDRNGLLP